MYSNELYHYGVKGMKWGVVRTKDNLNGSKISRSTINVKNIENAPTTVIKKHTRSYDRYLINQAKRKQRASGDAANLKYMTDKERQNYAKGRVKVMGNKLNAVRSETTNFIGKTLKTTGKGLIGIGTGGAAAVLADAVIYGSAVELGGLFVGAALSTPVALTAVSATTIARGMRYVKNSNAIKNVKI